MAAVARANGETAGHEGGRFLHFHNQKKQPIFEKEKKSNCEPRPLP